MYVRILTAPKTASRGIAMGKALVIEKQELNADLYKITPDQVNQEIGKYDKAVREATKQIEVLAASSDYFKAHLELVGDIVLYEKGYGKDFRHGHCCKCSELC
jgi:phosphotransferase system enzyme I (PtsI)